VKILSEYLNGMPSTGREDNVEMGLKVAGVNLSQNRYWGRAVVNTVTNFRVP
jgi:hypothetical protein